MKRKHAILILAVLVSAAIVGCSGTGSTENIEMELEEAKEEIKKLEETISDYQGLAQYSLEMFYTPEDLELAIEEEGMDYVVEMLRESRAAIIDIVNDGKSTPPATPEPLEITDYLEDTPQSSCFSSIGYYDGQLVVEFRDSGSIYQYDNFSYSDWRSFSQAESLGSYFNEYIKGNYPYTRLK